VKSQDNVSAGYEMDLDPNQALDGSQGLSPSLIKVNEDTQEYVNERTEELKRSGSNSEQQIKKYAV